MNYWSKNPVELSESKTKLFKLYFKDIGYTKY